MGRIATKEEYKTSRNIYAAAQVLDLRREDYQFANLHARLKRGIIAAYGDRTAEFTVAYDATEAETLGRMGEIAFLAFASRHRLHFTDHASCLHSQSRRDQIDFTLQSGPLSGKTVDMKTSKWG